jgi:type IV pilus assembly protein PilY1
MKTILRFTITLSCLFLVSMTAFADHSPSGGTYTSYYGTTNTTGYNTAAANWVGGKVYLDDDKDMVSLGTASNTTKRAYETQNNKIIVNPDDGYKIKSVQWSEATWSDASNITLSGSWNAKTGFTSKPTNTYEFDMFSTSGSKKYVIWVVFELVSGSISTSGGQVGAWYGTNNSIDYDNPTANGIGGWVRRHDNDFLTNRKADGYSRDSDDTKSFDVIPDTSHGYRIVSIQYGETLTPTSWTTVTFSSATSTKNFSIDINGGKQYVIWVIFESSTATSYTVTGSVDATSDAACNTSSGVPTVSPSSKSVSKNSTGSFTFSVNSSCIVESVNFNGVLTTAPSISGSTYTTPAITSDSSFVIKFRAAGYSINASVASSSPSGCGSISPSGSAIPVAQGASQPFVVTVNTGCSIAHVYVTDTNKSYNDFDVTPLPSNNIYTFNNVQANGVITVSFVSSVPASGNDYCQIPPFVQGQSTLTPNVLIIFDNSGSMGGGGSAYYKASKPYNCTSSHNATTNICSTIFYGYFDPYTMYTVDSTNSSVYLKDTATLNLASGSKSGNYLNFLNMDKVDVVRKILVGGKATTKASTALLSSANRSSTSVTKYLYTNSKKWIEHGTSEPTGLIQDLSSRVRFGLEVFGSTSDSKTDGGTIVAKLGSPKETLVSAVEGTSTDPTTNTPIAEALYEAVRYFEAKQSAYNSSTNYGDTTWNPTSSPIIQYACQKHFVLLLTDGEANSNDKLPGLTGAPTLNGYTDTDFDVNVWKNRVVTADQPSTTDGKYVDAVAYYAHVTDLRQTALGNDIAGTQNLTFYTVYAFGDGSGQKTLQMMSKYGGFESKDGNDAGTSPNKYPSPNVTSEWDKEPNAIPDTYFEGDDGAVLENNIMTAMSSILAKVASGTAASILSNSEGSGANLLQAVFYPNKIFENSTEVNWIGEVQNMWYYVDPFLDNSSVREDTDYVTGSTTHTLNLKSDYAARYYFNSATSETLVELKQDTNGDGLGDTVISPSAKVDDIKSLWRAGRQLRSKTAASRTIHTTTTGTSLLTSASDTYGGFYDDGTGNPRSTALTPTLLQVADVAEATKLINYIRGSDQSNYRNRKVSLVVGEAEVNWKEWKLGDVVSSTPRLQSSQKQNVYNLDSPIGYGDKSYYAFINTDSYKNRGMVYVGANDGMLHAFKLGKLTVSGSSISGYDKATLTGTNLGEEQWAFIPKNALPYLKYFTDRDNYQHLFYVDGPIVLSDLAVNSCTEANYWDCAKDTSAGSNWRSVLIGSMGLGGASRNKSDSCTSGVNGTCVKTPITDTGYSSYFAFDITDQHFDSSTGVLAHQPVLKWEFSHPELGYSTSGAAIVRITAKTTAGASDTTKNGKTFAVFASGPTGSIDTSLHQFKGKSDQNLKFFVVDLGATSLVLNTSYWIIDTGIKRAYGGNMVNAAIDTDRWNKAADGNYQDDAIYAGYTKANIDDTAAITSSTEWTAGGVVRLLTKEDPDPLNWIVSTVISGIGPVTAGVTKLQDRKNKKLWLYFGTGRFAFNGDDPTNQRYIMGVQEGCYTTSNALDKSCVTTSTGAGKPLVFPDDLKQQDTIGTLSSTNKGWYISLGGQASPLDAERNITDPIAQANGTVCYSTFMPTSDVCKFGGNSFLWCVNYATGGTPSAAGLSGKAIIQVSTGSLEEVSLKTALTANDGRKTGTALIGKNSSEFSIISNSGNKPPKKILQLQEK